MTSSFKLTAPRVKLLSNGRYTVMLTAAGGGFSQWQGSAVTRWREDPVSDAWGSHVVLHDAECDAPWSPSQQPFGVPADDAVFTASVATFASVCNGIQARLRVCVAHDVDAEVRELTVLNHYTHARSIDVTSYAELVLGSAAGDAAHTTFSKLFIQTEWDVANDVLLATRRRRSADEPSIWAAHFIVDAQTSPSAEGAGDRFETDRARFIGRGRTLRNALAFEPSSTLSDTDGCVLDPVFSRRHRIDIAAGAQAQLAFCTVVAATREEVIAACEALRSRPIDNVFAAAADAVTQSAVASRDAEAAAQLNEWTSALFYANAALRASPAVIFAAKGGAPVLWSLGISGDRPITIVEVADDDGLADAERLLGAQRGWHRAGIAVDVVVIAASSKLGDALQSRHDAQKKFFEEIASGVKSDVFVLAAADVSTDARTGLFAVARVVIGASAAGSANTSVETPPGRMVKSATPRIAAARRIDAERRNDLVFDNGYGGFDIAAREYVVELEQTRCTPMPWINVVANPDFGFFASAEGGGYTWSQNSQQNAITTWPNDPVSDVPREVLYLADLESGAVWSATASPIRVPAAHYRARHGKGYVRFEGNANGIDVDLLQFVPVDDTIKISRLILTNRGSSPRKLAITGYVDWALAPNGANAAMTITTQRDHATGALFARNAWRAEFGEHVAFIDFGGAQSSCSGDRAEVIGMFGDAAHPAAASLVGPLSDRTGAALAPCGALRCEVEIAAGPAIELVFLLGDAASADDARALVKKYRGADLDAVLAAVSTTWNEVFDTLQVKTPDKAMDVMLNDCLPYQALACRVWARTAYYQASGAYGFRDQLQDVMALTLSRPDITRAQLVRAAARQFVEGDVQHWWQPPSGVGIRTRMTDDRVWLPYVAMHYISETGDDSLLEEVIPFVEGDLLKDGQDEAYFVPNVSATKATFFEHCARALDVSLGLGAHGLPLIGTGDWNDGMNRVGEKGRGESVWLAWLLLAAIDRFAPVADARGETDRAQRWRDFAAKIGAAVEDTGWDGQWYRRGYYDDGSPLGSADNDACRIDAIAQSWSVMSGGADEAHARASMQAVDAQLILRDEAIALLFTPPFDKGDHDPGYIKGYPPGIRENGGQYTHGTIWSIFAFAGLGEGGKAAGLFGLLNPIRHAATAEAIERYKVEPYVVCADVYSVAPHVGRGGWTWYTGSAGWLYRAGVEAVLGFHKRGDALLIDPCIPAAWPGFSLSYRHRRTRYEIEVDNAAGVQRGVIRVELDGNVIASADDSRQSPLVPLSDDGAVHRVRVVLG